MSAALVPDIAPPLPLHELEAEQAVLGAILFDNDTMNALGALRPEHFFDPVHQRIFAKLREEIAAGRYVDGVGLRAWACGDSGIQQLGPNGAYLMRLMDAAAPLRAQALAYAALVRDLALRRAIADAADEAAYDAATRESDAADVIVTLERRLADIADTHAPYGLWRGIDDIMAKAIARAEQGEAKGISTGLAKLDEITGGLAPGSLWVIAGASSMGKSLVAQAIALNVATEGHGVGYVHLEMGELSIGLRAATAMAHDPKVRDHNLTNGNPTYLGARRQNLGPHGWRRLKHAADEARLLPFRVDARPHQTLSQIEAGAKRLKRLMERAGTPLRVLFIDHEGLIASEKDRRAKWEEVSDRIVRLQGVAKQLDVVVVVAVQINRDGASRDGDQRPHMGHLANSSDIERCADVICLLYREAYFAQRKPESKCSDEDYDKRNSNALEIIVDKSRDGVRKTVNAILDVSTGYLAEDA